MRSFGYLGASSSDLQTQIIAAANSAGVPSSIALAVAQQESGFNQNAVSPVGAVGIFQLMPSSFPGQAITDTTTNIQLGISYLAQLYQKYGNWNTALAAYNWGPGNVDKSTSIPQQVQNYVASVLGLAGSQDASVAPIDDSSDGSGVDPSSTGVISPLWWVGGALAGGLFLVWVLED
jgi:hypothetical protein